MEVTNVLALESGQLSMILAWVAMFATLAVGVFHKSILVYVVGIMASIGACLTTDGFLIMVPGVMLALNTILLIRGIKG